MIKSAFRHILLGVTVVASAAVLFVWFNSYLRGSAYRWVELQQELPNATFQATRITIAGGGLSFLREEFSTSDDAFADFLGEYARSSAWRPNPARSPYWSNPKYPSIFLADDSILGSLGVQWRSIGESYPGVVRTRRVYTFPIWPIFLLVAAYPLYLYYASVTREQMEDRLALGMCPTCGTCVDDGTERCPACDHKVPMPHFA